MGEGVTKRRHYNAELGQMVWLPRKLYGWLRSLALAEKRPISRQLELIVEEWVRWALARAVAGEGDAERVERLRAAEQEWMESK